jgi:CHAD domain-containing protein
MAFKLEPHEGTATGIRRIVDEELAAAIDDLEGRGPEDPDEAVHDARKRLKKARAVVRLVRDDLGADVQRSETAALRDAARRLSGVRDAYVLLETLATVEHHADGALPAADVRALRAALERRRDSLAEVPVDTGAAVEELVAARSRAAEWALEDERFPARSLKRIYARGRRAMEEAFEHGDDDSWHEWRKRVKDLWYSLRILEPTAGKQLKGAVEEADALSEALGDHNDVALLRAAADGSEPILAALDRRRDELRLAAVPLGRRLYAESPKRYTRRLSAYWDARAAEADARAVWLEPEVAGRVRELLAAKESADAAGKRRITAQLRELGFRASDFDVPRRRGGFGAADFDALVSEGAIRVGSPAIVPS